MRQPFKLVPFLIFDKFIKVTAAALNFSHHNFVPFHVALVQLIESVIKWVLNFGHVGILNQRL